MTKPIVTKPIAFFLPESSAPVWVTCDQCEYTWVAPGNSQETCPRCRKGEGRK